MKLRFFKNKKELPETLKKSLQPPEEFLAQGKRNFLAAYDASAFSHASVKRSGFALGLKFGIGVLAVIAVVVGASAYADTANVSVQSPLYPLKRLGETVQLAVTPPAEKAQVQATFAVRRANEIKDLETTNPSSTLIPALTQSLAEDVSSSLSSASTTGLTAKPLGSLCATFSGQLGVGVLARQDLLARFNAQCGSTGTSTIHIHIGFHASSTTDARATSTINSSSSYGGGNGYHHATPSIQPPNGFSTTTQASSTITASGSSKQSVVPITLPKLSF